MNLLENGHYALVPDSSPRLLARLAQITFASVIGYIVGGLVVGFIWVFAVYEAPDGGSGNASEGYGWFGIGGLVGAGIALGVLAWHVRRSRRP